MITKKKFKEQLIVKNQLLELKNLLNAKEKLLVFGAGGHAKVAIDVIEQQGNYEIAGLLDDDIKLKGCRFFGYPVLGLRSFGLAGTKLSKVAPS